MFLFVLLSVLTWSMPETVAEPMVPGPVAAESAAAGLGARAVEFRGAEYRVVDLDLKQVDLRLYWKRADGSAYENLSSVREAIGKKFIMATNSGIYARDYRPLGLHIERGVRLHTLNRSRASKGNFFVQPNGVFFLSGGVARILETGEFAKTQLVTVGHAAKTVAEATQSGPLLLRKGVVNAHFHAGSENKKLRSGVGVNREGHVVFAISGDAVSFYDFAMLFREKLNCTDALYLDGTISTLLVGDSAPDVQIAPYVGIWGASLKN